MSRHRPIARRVGRSCPLALVLLLLWPAPAVRGEVSGDLDGAERQVKLLEDKAALTRHEYLLYEDREFNLERFESRLNDGQALMLLEDYARAAIIFFELVENERFRDQPGYADAMFNLAEALFFNRNFVDARAYYQRVMDHPRGRPFRARALARMMQIALNIRNYDQVDESMRTLQREGGGVSSEAQYLFGKTLFERGRLEEALQIFGAIPAGQAFYFQARYMLAVLLIRQDKLEQALEQFTALSRLTPKTEAEKNVVELAHMARGRILYDLGREDQALDAYQAVPHTSKNFDRTLFEICMTYLQRSDRAEDPEARAKWLTEAARTVEILEVSTPDSTLLPRAYLLQGAILEKMGRFEDAAQAFLKVGQTYNQVKQQLDDLVTRHSDPVSYFNEVAGKNLDSFDLSAYLPAVAVKWMSGQDEMNSALGIVKEIDTGRRFVRESRALLAKLDELITSPQDRLALFPVLAEGTKRCLEIENARVVVERTLAMLEERVIEEHVSPAERRELQAARDERERLEGDLDRLPVTKKDFDGRESRVKARVEALEQSVFQSTITVKGMKAQLSAMEEWIKQNEARLAGREEGVREFREEIRRGWATANQLEKEMEDLANLLATEKARIGIAGDVMAGEEALRDRYHKALERERELASRIHSRLAPEGSAQVTRINGLRQRLEKVSQDTAGVRRELNARLEQEVDKLKLQSQHEAANLAEYEVALQKLETESQNLAGEVAFRALEEVRKKFYDLVLESDVGILDVAWGRMQEKNRLINELTRKKNAEARQLQKEYKSVLEEVQ